MLEKVLSILLCVDTGRLRICRLGQDLFEMDSAKDSEKRLYEPFETWRPRGGLAKRIR